MNIDQILPLFEGVKRAGSGRYMAVCPMLDHRDSEPSVSVSQDVNTGNILMKCWGCNTAAPGLCEALGIPISDLFGDPGHVGAVSMAASSAPLTAEDQTALARRVSAASKNLERAANYIEKRFNLSVEQGRKLHIGVDDSFGADHLIIPMCNPEGEVVGMQGRRLTEGSPRWRSVSGSGWSKAACFGWDLDGPVIITEGLSDPLSVVGWARLPAIGVRGASLTDEGTCAQIQSWLNGRLAVVVGDTGEAGERFAAQISECVGIPLWRLPMEDGDLSDYLMAGGSMEACLTAAGFTQPEPDPPTPAEVDRDLANRILANIDGAVYDEQLIEDLTSIPKGRLDVIVASVVSRAPAGNTGNYRILTAAITQTLRDRQAQPAPEGGGGGDNPHVTPPEGFEDYRDELPTILWNPADQTELTEFAVRSAMDEYDNGDFYRASNGQYVKVIEDEIVPLKESGVKSMLSRMGNWRVVTGNGELGHVPLEATKMVSDPSWESELPEIKRRVEVPFMLADGSIVSTTGFHEGSGVYLLPNIGDPIVVPEVPAVVTDEHVKQARKIFEDVVEGFRFADNASKSNLLAMTLTSPLRELFKESPMVPLIVSTAPQSGSGKGTSIRVPLSTAGVGIQSLSTTAYNPDEAELEKKLVAKLLKKSTYIFLDNIRGHVSSSVLEQMLTAANYDGRTLGHSEVNALSTLVLWAGTLQSTGTFNRDLTRRCLPVSLTKNFRGDWQHTNIEAYLASRRGEMIWACFVVARKWLQEGGPVGSGRLDGYSGWLHTIGGMLEHVLGYEDLLGNLSTFRKAQDENAVTIDGLLERWLEMHGETEQPARMAVEEMEDPGLHQLLNLRNPQSSRQVLMALTRVLDTQRGYIVNGTHMWTPVGMVDVAGRPEKTYRCEPVS